MRRSYKQKFCFYLFQNLFITFSILQEIQFNIKIEANKDGTFGDVNDIDVAFNAFDAWIYDN